MRSAAGYFELMMMDVGIVALHMNLQVRRWRFLWLLVLAFGIGIWYTLGANYIFI